MTPYDQAITHFAEGLSADAVIARLSAAGIDPGDAKAVVRAARAKVSRPTPIPAPANTTVSSPVPKLVEPGSRSWVLVVKVAMVFVTLSEAKDAAMAALLVIWTLLSDLNGVFIAVASWLGAETVLCLVGTIMLLQNRRAARRVLLGYCAMAFVAGCITFANSGPETTDLSAAAVIGLGAFFIWSKSLRATLNR